jgi:peptidyl-prolyl cis-trans isomerase SurA
MKQIFGAMFLAAACVAPALAQTMTAALPGADDASIAAVVNGQVITSDDVLARARLLALSTGMAPTPAVVERLTPQITNELVDQTLELQEINRRNVVVAEGDIEAAVAHIEQGNNLPAGSLRAHLAQAGVPFSTLVQQLRTELGWQTVLHQVLGPDLQPTPGDIRAEKKALAAQIGQTQYHVAEIFIPVADPADDATARNFAATVIQQLRLGAPFPEIAAQFSQADSALQGGDLGFVSLSQMDPATAAVVATMPSGAISNPIRVPGGYDIVQLQEIRRAGAATGVALTLRQAFAPFPAPVSGGQVGPAQVAVINKLVAQGRGAHSCDDIAAINAGYGNVRPADPGPVNLADVTPPQFQAVLANLAIGQVSEPLVAQDGVSVVMVCSRQSVAQSLPSDQDIRNLIVEQRVTLESQQLLDDLRHRSIITRG